MKHFETEASIGLVMLSGKIYDYDDLIATLIIFKIFKYSWLINNKPISYPYYLWHSVILVHQ